MKHYIMHAIGGVALMLAPAFAQTPRSESEPAETQRYKTRMENQQDRIQQGVRSGELSPRQARRLGRQDRHINRETRRMAARNGGDPTERQERRIRRQMNQQSRRIYRAKH